MLPGGYRRTSNMATFDPRTKPIRAQTVPESGQNRAGRINPRSIPDTPDPDLASPRAHVHAHEHTRTRACVSARMRARARARAHVHLSVRVLYWDNHYSIIIVIIHLDHRINTNS